MITWKSSSVRIGTLLCFFANASCAEPTDLSGHEMSDGTSPAAGNPSAPSALGDSGPATFEQDATASGPSASRAVRDASDPGQGATSTSSTDAAGLAPDAAGPAADAALPLEDGGTPRGDAQVPASGRDKFGVEMIYATKAGGREWQLPSNAEASSAEWNVETNPVSRVADGVFHTSGNNGETRLSVSSPSGRAWWRNVEMTGYFRYTGAMDSNGQERHWEFSARSAKHTASNIVGTQINQGVSAPSGTSTWPGYPYGSSSVNGHCLGTSYHGNVYVAGHTLFEKEVSHSGGYAGPRGRANGALVDPLNRWFGFKYILRNADSERRVHMELWLDGDASGKWKLISQYDDVAGGWAAGNASLDGCTGAPFNYKPDQLMTWAGPWLTFRSDSIGMDFKSLSAREIAPL